MPNNSAKKIATEAKEPKIEKQYDSIVVKVTKGRKAMLQVHAAKQGETLTAFINRAIDNQLLRDS